MPAGVVKTKKDEKYWDKSKKNVRESKGKPQSKFKDQDWGLVQHIFALRKKKHEGKGKKKKKKAGPDIPMIKRAKFNIVVEPFEPLVDKAMDLIESKAPGTLTNQKVQKVVVESEAGDHLGKVQSDEPGVIFISVNKIKNLLGANQNEDEVVRQIALTIAHELGHIRDEMKGGEGPAETAEREMAQKIDA